MVRFLSFPYASVWAIRLTSPCFVYRYYTTRRKDLGVATLFLDQSSVVLHLTGLNFSIPLLTFVPLCGVTAWLASGVLSLSAMASEWFHKHDDPDDEGWHW